MAPKACASLWWQFSFLKIFSANNSANNGLIYKFSSVITSGKTTTVKPSQSMGSCGLHCPCVKYFFLCVFLQKTRENHAVPLTLSQHDVARLQSNPFLINLCRLNDCLKFLPCLDNNGLMISKGLTLSDTQLFYIMTHRCKKEWAY